MISRAPQFVFFGMYLLTDRRRWVSRKHMIQV